MLEKSLYSRIVQIAMNNGITMHRLRDGTGIQTCTDYIGHTIKGKFVYLEVKVDRRTTFTAIDWSKFSPHQIEWLRHGICTDCISIVVIWHEKRLHWIRLKNTLELTKDYPISSMKHLIVLPRTDISELLK